MARPGQIQNVKAVRSGDYETVTLTWDSDPDAASYEVRRAASRRAQHSTVAGTPIPATLVDSGLDADINYTYVVRGVGSLGEKSVPSASVFTSGQKGIL